ncbi:heme-binding protein [Schaalia vaccimaxillae]|uniref:heme-binding protein n=1 Tax=Schaalia vaccimaxillae TaxID=183916 RepID=UPI0003B3A2A0|nr:heme-binding protein [Schaalia vaccimaxillae]
MSDLQAQIDILAQQEDLLRFPYFTHRSAWDFGIFMVERARELNTTIAVSIRTPNGSILFQHLPDGTNHLNELWMRRKFNTVTTFESSSLRATYECRLKDEGLAQHGLKDEDYALCGGGFPIRTVGSSALVGVLLASNLPHIEDHEFLTSSLREYLHITAPQFHEE